MNTQFIQKFIFLIAFLSGIIIGIAVLAFRDFDGIEKLNDFRPEMPSQLIDIRGELISEYFTQKRSLISYEDFPPHLIHAFVAMEDNRFFNHFGIDPKGIIRAFFINILAGRVREGGSTITQQLAKIVLTNREKSLVRKLKEAWISILLERRYSKKEILNLYFNQIYLGHGAYGVEAASQFYFGKPAKEMNIAESAMLSTLPSAPNLFSPLKNPHRSRERHKIALIRMVENGFLSPADAEKAYSEFWQDYQKKLDSPSLTAWGNRVDKAPYFTEYCRRILEPMVGKDKLYTAGLKIYSTLDIKMQQAAQIAVSERLEIQRKRSKPKKIMPREQIISDEFSVQWELLANLFHLKDIRQKQSQTQLAFAEEFSDSFFDDAEIINMFTGVGNVVNTLHKFRITSESINQKDQVEAALISIDHTNGHIRAMVGGSGFRSDNQLNRAVQMRRQTGSSFKPIVYATAMEKHGYTPATLVEDTPLFYLDEMGDFWIPENFSGEYLGPIRLRRALELSRNVISVKVAENIGIADIIEKAGLLIGLTTKEERVKRFPHDLSIALGSTDITPLEMARAFSVFARGGKNIVPFAIIKIVDADGNILYDGQKIAQNELEKMKKNNQYQIFSHTTATMINSMLKSAVSRGTGGAARSTYNKTVAGKTGSTNNFRDAWFVGFNHTIATAIWLGFDTKGLTLGPGQSGGGVAAPLFGRYYGLAQGHLPDRVFGFYGGVVNKVICAKSGKLPSRHCHERIEEMFPIDHTPKNQCDLCIPGGNLRIKDDNLDSIMDPDEQNIKKIPKQKIPQDDIFNQ